MSLSTARETVNKQAGALADVNRELTRAREIHKPMNSHHEAYATILEELDEYWDEVKKRDANRDAFAIYEELKQVAAMAIRAMVDVCLKEG